MSDNISQCITQSGESSTKTDIKSMLPEELSAFLAEMGQPRFRAGQVFKWLHEGVESFSEMTDLPKALRERLDSKCYIANAAIERRLCSKLDETKKYLFRLNDGEYVESVLMSYHHGYSICISTQVGCRMGCVFCATGRSGFSRNLAPSEMLAQIQAAQRSEGVRISNIVLMGMGEPLDNFDNVMKFLSLVSHPQGICIGMRHISVSTCGLVDRIEQLIEMKPQFTLSVSLHAPDNELRSSMMPVNKKWDIDKLLDVCKRYADATGRRISFEYALVAGKNDTEQCALRLAQRLHGMLCHVNLIPVNPVDGSGCDRSQRQRVLAFQEALIGRGINATVRRTLGGDIDASCGQLRRRRANSEQ